MTKEIRWIQRFNNWMKALNQLTKFMEKRELNDLEKQGLIKSFEYNYELAWNVLKDFYEYQGTTGIQGSRDSIQEAFNKGMIENGDVWFDMIKKRSLTVHTYDGKITEEITNTIVDIYYSEFLLLKEKLQELKNKRIEQNNE